MEEKESFKDFIKQAEQRENELVKALSLKIVEFAKELLSDFEVICKYSMPNLLFCELEKFVANYRKAQKEKNWTDFELEAAWERYVVLRKMALLDEQLKKED